MLAASIAMAIGMFFDKAPRGGVFVLAQFIFSFVKSQHQIRY